MPSNLRSTAMPLVEEGQLTHTRTSTGGSARPTDDDFTYEAPKRNPYPCLIRFLFDHIFKMFVFTVFVGTAVYLIYYFIAEHDKTDFRSKFVDMCKVASVPLVSLLFTWFHVWLALTMMFYPIEFYGIGAPKIPECVGLPINGWQGIVPRKRESMAQRTCDAMIGSIITVDEFVERVDPTEFFNELQDTMARICSQVLVDIMTMRFPSVWPLLSDGTKEELQKKVFEETRETFVPAMIDLRQNIASILDLKQMAVDAMIADPQVMVDMFRNVAASELEFIQHFAAVMGFVLGLVQVLIYVLLSNWPYIDYVMLPVSGLIIGYYTNFLAMKMTFAPVWPHMYCNNRVNIQGVFLKRQPEASASMANNICRQVVDSKAMINHLFKDGMDSPSLDNVWIILQKHINRVFDDALVVSPWIVRPIFGNKTNELKKDVVDIIIKLVPQYSEKVEQFVDKKMRVEETLARRLSRLTPPEFESIIHPIFEADEWILLLVGAVLGVVIGICQAVALQYIN